MATADKFSVVLLQRGRNSLPDEVDRSSKQLTRGLSGMLLKLGKENQVNFTSSQSSSEYHVVK